MSHGEYLLYVAEGLRSAQREGGIVDVPEGERLIRLSDTWATKIAENLDRIGRQLREKDSVLS